MKLSNSERYFYQKVLTMKEVDKMLKKCFTVVFAGVLISLFATGCTVIREYPPQKEDFNVKKAEYELGRDLLQAFVKNDAEKFVSLLPEETRTKFTVENFKTTRKSVLESVGEPVSYSYVTALEFPSLTPQIWKVRFRRYNINKTKEYTSEVIFKVITGMINDKEAVITGFHFL